MRFKDILSIDPLFRVRWRRKDIFTQIFRLQGAVYRQHKNRKTLRFTLNGKGYFVKMHKGVGWREIIRNLLNARLPVLGAHQEWRALEALDRLGIKTPKLVGYGCRGHNPVCLKSFVITEELPPSISLEDYCHDWVSQPPALVFKRALINEIAHIASTLHTNGINHRDFYLCHFFLKLPTDGSSVTRDNLQLYLIDLHRAQIRKRTPPRWIIKDLAGLYFSSMEYGLTNHDILRFIKTYTGQNLHAALRTHQGFWQAVTKRAVELYGKEKRHAFAANEVRFPNNWMLSSSPFMVIGEQLLRKIPGKRWVLQARWGTRQVVVKLFADWRRAQRELIGYDALVTAGILTPRLLHHDWVLGGKLYILLFERIHPSDDFNTLWVNADEIERRRLLNELLALITKMHQAGLQQRDLHLKNFLLSDNKIYTLDPSEISRTKDGQPLTESSSVKNLALMFAQLPARYDVLCETLYPVYTNERGIIFTGAGLANLKKWIMYWRDYRLSQYERKVLRSTSRLICRKDKHTFSICDRSYDTKAMRALLQDLDAALAAPTTQILKAGNSSTVGLVEVDGRLLVVKRYNIKSFWHAIKRAVQPSRAATSWRNAHCLELLNIATPKPVAMLEKRFGLFRNKAYFISEYVAGIKLQDYVDLKIHTQEEFQHIIDEIKDVFVNLAAAKISHGDLKATNILLVEGKPVLLDLDAMRLHRFTWGWQRAALRDQQRFLQNWQHQPHVEEAFS